MLEVMPKRKAIVMLCSQDLRFYDRTTWLTSKRTNLILLDLSLSSTRHPCTKTLTLSTCHPHNSLVTVTFVIIKLPSFNSTLLSPFRDEILYVIELIKRNAYVIRFIKRLFENQHLNLSGDKAKGVNSPLVVSLVVPPLRGKKIVSWTQLDLFLGYYH